MKEIFLRQNLVKLNRLKSQKIAIFLQGSWEIAHHFTVFEASEMSAMHEWQMDVNPAAQTPKRMWTIAGIALYRFVIDLANSTDEQALFSYYFDMMPNDRPLQQCLLAEFGKASPDKKPGVTSMRALTEQFDITLAKSVLTKLKKVISLYSIAYDEAQCRARNRRTAAQVIKAEKRSDASRTATSAVSKALTHEENAKISNTLLGKFIKKTAQQEISRLAHPFRKEAKTKGGPKGQGSQPAKPGKGKGQKTLHKPNKAPPQNQQKTNPRKRPPPQPQESSRKKAACKQPPQNQDK